MSVFSLRTRLFWRSFLLQAGFSEERRQGLGFAWSIDPALRAAYASDRQALSAARARHLSVFNVQPHASGLPLGVVAAMESRDFAGRPDRVEAIARMKSTLGSCLSGAADPFFWGALRPLSGMLALAVWMGAARLRLSHPFLLGAALGLLTFNAAAFWARWTGLSHGLAQADAAAVAFAAFPVQRWIGRTRLAAGIAVAAAVCLGLAALPASRLYACVAVAAGAGLSRRVGGTMRLVAASAAMGTAAWWFR